MMSIYFIDVQHKEYVLWSIITYIENSCQIQMIIIDNYIFVNLIESYQFSN